MKETIFGDKGSSSSGSEKMDFEKNRTEGYGDEHQYLHLQATNMALTDISVIASHYVWLLSIDLSGNRLKNTSICPLTKLKNLVSLKLNENLFGDPYMPPIKHLQCLEMKGNEIGSLHRIYHPNLAVLDLSYNRIETIHSADAWKLKRLEKLILRHNKMKWISGIEYLSLTKLYLAENEIKDLTGIDILVNLNYLHLRDNPLSDLKGFTESNSLNLGYLNIRKCLIEQVEELEKIRVLRGLKTLIVQENFFNYPSHQDEFRIRILAVLPGLNRIDKKQVSQEEYYEARMTQYDNEKV